MQVLRKAFQHQFDPELLPFVASVEEDAELTGADLKGSMAHCAMLAEQGLITPPQAQALQQGLTVLAEAAEKGEFELKPEYEDVHMNVEKKLEELIGKDALRLHTARSRNDQVALDFRIYVTEQCAKLQKLLLSLQKGLLEKANQYSECVMPGYTHLQPAQPVFFAHAMLAFAEMFNRDIARFKDTAGRASVSPLGAGAQAGSSLPIDPHFSAKQLGFTGVFSNSIDAVTDRDFAAEFLLACALTATHLSQLAETLIVWNTREFGFIEFCDSVTTTSSLMPQKKNPDPVELVRGKAGVSIGELINLLVTLKGLPLGYNRDLQETKPPVIHASKAVAASLSAMKKAVAAISLNTSKMLEAAGDPELMATDLVEYLVLKGVAFREAHEVVARAVQAAKESGVKLNNLPLSAYKRACASFDADLYDVFDAKKSASAKTSHGGTGNAAYVLSKKLQELAP